MAVCQVRILNAATGETPMKTQDIEYHADGARLVGQLVVDDAKAGKRPGIIVAHEGGGLTDHAKNSARRLAEAGYIAFALDYYGDGKPLTDMNEVMPRLGVWMADPTGIRVRAHAALEVLMAQPETDSTRLAAIGYCFGGTTALEMARAGDPLRAVVGFHAGLASAKPAQAGAVKAVVLAQIGADDPIVPPEQRAAFEQEMTSAKVDWRMTLFGGVGHSFTNPGVNALGRAGFAYDKSADERSWRAMLDLFDEVF
jgi:dienelactone hydrolase